MCQFAPGKVVPCENALRQPRKHANSSEVGDADTTEELRSLLRRKEYEVKLSCGDAPSLCGAGNTVSMGIIGSRRDGLWGFIDKIQPTGLIARWNQDQADDKQVRVGDKIVAVCGQRAGIDFCKGTGFLVDE